MKTRVGKIARLPKAIREELNRRLSNSERARDLARWLNELPEVQKVLADMFGGNAIHEVNLSHWKQGGYLDWLRHQEVREHVRAVTEQSDDLNQDEGGYDLSESLAMLISTELAVQAKKLHEIKDPKEHWRLFQQIARELSRVRRDDQRFRRTELRRQQWESTLEPLEPEAEDQPNEENEQPPQGELKPN